MKTALDCFQFHLRLLCRLPACRRSLFSPSAILPLLTYSASITQSMRFPKIQHPSRPSVLRIMRPGAKLSIELRDLLRALTLFMASSPSFVRDTLEQRRFFAVSFRRPTWRLVAGGIITVAREGRMSIGDELGNWLTRCI